MIIVIKYRLLLTSLPHHFNTTVAKNFPGYDYAIWKKIGRSAPPPPPPNRYEIFKKGELSHLYRD
jgi:hypothetical protein